MVRKRRPHPALAAVAALTILALSGCGIRIPADPHGTLDRIAGGELRVGASPAMRLVEVADGDVSGRLPTLVEGFAAAHGARVSWTVGSEEELVDGLEDGRLDLAIGGMTDASPWSKRVSVTRAYPQLSPDGRGVVVLLPMGENALQAAFEAYLDEEVDP